jgi:hypothetical protein
MDNPRDDDEDQRIILNNVFRFLEAYRSNVLFGAEATKRRRAETAKEKLALRRPATKNVKEVREALQQTLDSVFAGVESQRAIGMIEHVLRSIAYPDAPHAKPSREESERAVLFFRELAKRLRGA